MNINKLPKLATLTLTLAFIINTSYADCLSHLKVGQDYQKIQISNNYLVKLTDLEMQSKKPVLIEFFWYGCSHCYHMDDSVNKLVASHQKDIIFKRYPVNFPRWDSGAKLFFTLDEMGLENQLHTKVFDIIQKDRINIMDDKNARDKFLSSQKVDVKKFDAIYNSFGISNKMRLSQQVAENYKLNSSPVFIINNTYQVDPGLTHSYENTIKSLDVILKDLEKKNCK